MRVLFATYAERTHYLEMVPLGWALRNAGHDVLVASQPALVGTITGSGLTAVPVGADGSFRRVRRAMAAGRPGTRFPIGPAGDDQVTWESVQERYREVLPWWWRLVNEPMAADLVALCRQWRPDLVVWDGVTFAGAIAAEACGAAHARFMFGLDVFGRLRDDFHRLGAARPAADRPDPVRRWLGALGARAGVPFSEALVTGHFTIDHVPGPLRLATGPRIDRVPLRYTPYNGRAQVPPWLRVPPARPRVCLSLGVSAVENTGGYAVGVADVLDALAGLDAEIVATVPAAAQGALGTVPPNTRVVDYAPLNALAPTCAAVINHGGTGTLCTTAVHGVPQLVLPHSFDEPLLATGLQACGAGLALDAAEATGPRVASLLRELLDGPSFAEGAARLRDGIRSMPAPGAVAAELERRVAAHRAAQRPTGPEATPSSSKLSR